MPLPWPLLRSEPLGDHRIFKVRRDFKRSPRTGAEHDFFVLECPDWVNVIALTPEGGLVCVEQFRHGTNTVELEIPGGVMDPHETDPVATGVRELREETGYEGSRARVIGAVWANPAIQGNTVHTVLVEDCRPTGTVEPDCGEDLATRLIPAAEIASLVSSGKVRHSLVVAALLHFELWHRAG
ncbi:MAG: NUDIX hydrolase [Verrucomicrobia bacterium]|nr:NUDIX hydrolase [Verrucomicrobiota bacterium]